MPKPRGPRLAIVTWDDAHSDLEQTYADSVEHAAICVKTAGWIVKSDAVGVTLFSEHITEQDGSEAWRGRSFIPASLIKTVDYITVRKKAPHVRATPPSPESQSPVPDA